MQSRKKLTKGSFPSLLCTLMVLLAACGDGNAQNKQILIVPLGNSVDVKTLDPAKASDLDSIGAIQMVFTGLVSFDDNLKVQNQLAASNSVASDGVTWTFKLKSNLKFSDGQPLTSKDVVYSIDRALQPATKSGTALTYLNLIKGADELQVGKRSTLIGTSLLTPNDQTIIIIISRPCVYFLKALAYPASYVIEKSMIDKYGDQFADHLKEGIGGSGPWKISKYAHGQAIEFVPNLNYYGVHPRLKKVVMVFYQNSDTIWRAYQAGQVHSSVVSSSQINNAKKLPSQQFHQVRQLAVLYYAMNFLVRPFNNLKIRQAFALAINKDELASTIYENSVVPTNHIVPDSMPDYNNKNLTGPLGIRSTKGDRVLAKKLFDEGLAEEHMTLASLPSITFSTSAISNTARNEVAAVQQMWESTLGVKITIETIEVNTFWDQVSNTKGNAHGLQIWRDDWFADYPDPQDWLTLLFSSNAPQNAMNYGTNQTPQNSEEQANQALLVQADTVANTIERVQKYNRAEQELINDVARVPIYQETNTYVQKPCVAGTVDNALGLIPPDDWARISISPDLSCADVSWYSAK